MSIGTTLDQLRKLSAGWGPLPSTAPWPDEAPPELTTGYAVGAADRCIRHIEGVDECLRLIMRLSAGGAGDAQTLAKIHRIAGEALQGRAPKRTIWLNVYGDHAQAHPTSRDALSERDATDASWRLLRIDVRGDTVAAQVGCNEELRRRTA